MIRNLQIIFDFKNLKEYISSYGFEEIDNKKIRVKNAPPKQEDLGTFLLEFMNTDFDDPIDLYIFVKKYLFIHLLNIYNNSLVQNTNNFIELDKNVLQDFSD